MGIDFSHCDASWSYNGFSSMRTALAKHVGITLENMKGFSESAIVGRGLPGEDWPEVEDEPLVLLLNHSDCDGELTPEELRILLPRLKVVVKEMMYENELFEYDSDQLLELMDGMELAISHDEPLQFQ